MSHHSCFASEETERLLAANGLRDLDSAFRLGKPLDDLHERRAIRHDFKRVVRCELTGPEGVTRVYIKRQWRRGRLVPRPTDVRRGIGWKCTPIHEWHGLRTLQQAGFLVAEPLALFWRGWGLSRGAVVTRAVPPQYSLADLILGGDFERMSPERQAALIEGVADVVGRLHRAHISWRSMKAKHFYPEETAQGMWRMWLIDCEGVYTQATRHDCLREWGAFLRYISTRAPNLQEAFSSSYCVPAAL